MNKQPTPAGKVDQEQYLKATDKLRKYLQDGKKNIYLIALQLAKVERERLYMAGGYKSATEYALKELDLKRSTCSNYIRVANRFLEEQSDGRAKVLLTNTAKEIDPSYEYPITTLSELLVLDDKTAKAITDDGEIDSLMSQKKVREVVSLYKPLRKPAKAKQEESEATDPEPADDPEDVFDAEVFNACSRIYEIGRTLGCEELIQLLKVLTDKLGYNIDYGYLTQR